MPKDFFVSPRRPASPRLRPVLRSIPSLPLWICAAALLGSGPVRAEPEPVSDAVLELLLDQGLLVPGEPLPRDAAWPGAPGTAAPTAPAMAPVAANTPIGHRFRETASDLVLSAMNFLGVPYRRGGASAQDGFDCSGFTRHVFQRSVGLVLPRRADEQASRAGLLEVARAELRPGDLVFFNTMRRAFSHVGIYVGEGRFIHAPRSGAEVRIEDMRQAYWTQRFNGARRAELADAGVTAPQ